MPQYSSEGKFADREQLLIRKYYEVYDSQLDKL